MERLRTGRPTKSAHDDEIYGLYAAAAQSLGRPATIQIRYLAMDQVERVGLKARRVNTRSNEYDAAIVGILKEGFPPDPEERKCPAARTTSSVRLVCYD